MAFGVGKREGAAPGAAKHQPPLDPQLLAELLHIGDQVGSGVAGEVGVWVAGVGRAPAAVALIEEHDAIGARIEEPAPPGRAARAGAAMHHNGWLPRGVAASLPVDAVAVSHVEESVRVRLDL